MKRGLLRVLVDAGGARQAMVLIRSLESGTQCVVTRHDIHGDDPGDELIKAARSVLDVDGARVIEVSGESYLLQTEAAPLRMLIVGGVHLAQVLIPMAEQVGFEMTVIDPRPAFASKARFPGVEVDHRWPDEALAHFRPDSRTAVIALSHDPKIDDPALAAAMESDAFYIGALGSKSNHAKRLERLAERGYPERQLARIHGPVGLPLGGRSPAEIAVSTLAQVIQVRHRKLKA